MNMEKDEAEKITKAHTIAEAIGEKLRETKDIVKGIDLVSLARSLTRRRSAKIKK